MIIGGARNCLLVALLCLALPAGLMPQDDYEKKPDAPKAQTRKPSPQPVLAEATRASTDDAVKSTAPKKVEAGAPEEAPTEPGDSAVTEFRPATQRPETSGAASAGSPKASKKPSSRNTHGSVYGASGSAGNSTSRSGGSVGASSKSGKTSVYVETNRSRESQPTSK